MWQMGNISKNVFNGWLSVIWIEYEKTRFGVKWQECDNGLSSKISPPKLLKSLAVNSSISVIWSTKSRYFWTVMPQYMFVAKTLTVNTQKVQQVFLDLADVLTFVDIWDDKRWALSEQVGQHRVQLFLLFWVSPAIETKFKLMMHFEFDLFKCKLFSTDSHFDHCPHTQRQHQHGDHSGSNAQVHRNPVWLRWNFWFI